jgi:F420H(2)-dependent quinone reductase
MTDFTNPEALKNFNKSIVDEFRANGGKVTGPFTEADLLLLTTTGAKSGQHRVSPLAYFHIDDKLIVVGSFHGASVKVIPLFELQRA